MSSKLIPGRKRIRAPASDSSDDEQQRSTTVQKTARISDDHRNTAPISKTHILHTNHIRKNNINTANGREATAKTNKHTTAELSDSEDGGYKKVKKSVYDSESDDDSDQAQTKKRNYHMTKDRQIVFDFLNTANPNEFLSVKSVSQRKIEQLTEMRPFRDWKDIVERFQSRKGLSPDLLNNCQEFLTSRNNLSRIMSKCTKMVERLEQAVVNGAGISKQPDNLNSEFKLADYQLSGLNWLAVMHKEEMNGILADEMGLGKTIQVIAFMAWLKETGQAKGSHLLVVPSSTLDNWAHELERWCPDLIVEKYYGSLDERRSMRIGYAKNGLRDIDVLLTTYHTVGSSPEERKMFRVAKIHYVVFDEAHMLKNMTSQRYANLIRMNAERRLLLTGTPLQNNLLELMSLLCFVMPSMFARNTDDIKLLFQKNMKLTDDNEICSFEQAQIKQAQRIMKPFVLRRLKNVVLSLLPPKTEQTLKVKMTADQKDAYQEFVKSYSSEAGIVRATDNQSGFFIMMELRKLSNHPLLTRSYYSDETLMQIAEMLSTNVLYKKNPYPQYIFEELAILSDFQIQQKLEKFNIKHMDIPDHLILASGKFERLDELLPQLKRDGHRVLIFSQFTMMLDVLERYLDIRDHGYLRLDGQTNVTERQDMIDQYMNDADMFVFLLSTKAGGMGINLTAADTVIIHDIDFNPYNDKQAEDRCHRMGQKRPVTIYRLISEGTIEEGIHLAAQSKLELEKELTQLDAEHEAGDSGAKEQKCMVRILSMALGIGDEKMEKIEKMLSPSPKKIGGNRLSG